MASDAAHRSPPLRSRRIDVKVDAFHKGLRLDQVLAATIPDLSRRQARTLLDIGGVFLDGRRTKMASKLVRVGQKITVHLGGALTRAHGAAAEVVLPDYVIAHEDDDIVVVDKPPGLLTAPTPESDRNNLADLLSRRAGGRPAPIHVVHRIDLQTSGLLVFGKTDLANRVLSEAFRKHDIERAYTAVVHGAFPADVTTIDRPVGGRVAITHVESRQPLAGATLLGLRLETGRTHQIRLHCDALGHPVLGDPNVPGIRGIPRPPRMALHAGVLGFAHPATRAPLRLTSPLPPDLGEWLTRLQP